MAGFSRQSVSWVNESDIDEANMNKKTDVSVIIEDLRSLIDELKSFDVNSSQKSNIKKVDVAVKSLKSLQMAVGGIK